MSYSNRRGGGGRNQAYYEDDSSSSSDDDFESFDTDSSCDDISMNSMDEIDFEMVS